MRGIESQDNSTVIAGAIRSRQESRGQRRSLRLLFLVVIRLRSQPFRGFRVGDEARPSPVFVVRWEGALKGYLNSCPHVGTRLDWTPDKFFHPSEDYLICATHGALFRPEDGLCIAGPCEGDRLKAIEIAVEDGWIVYRG